MTETATPIKPCYKLTIDQGHDLLVLKFDECKGVNQIEAGASPPPAEQMTFWSHGIPPDLIERVENVGIEVIPVFGLGLPVYRVILRDAAERMIVRMMYAP